MTEWYAVVKFVPIPCNLYLRLYIMYLHSICILIPDGPDYTSSLLTAVFRGNSTAVVPVPTLPDYIVEGEESFTAAIVVPVDATMAYRVTRGSPATATVVIIDNDSKFSAIIKCTYLNYLATRLQFTHCLAVSIAPSTDPSTEVTVIVATVVVVLVVMTTTVAIVIAVAVFCRKRSKCR